MSESNSHPRRIVRAGRKRPAPRAARSQTRRLRAVAPEPSETHKLPKRRIEQARHPWLALGLILGFAALIVGGIWFVYASGMVANRYKPDIERELSKALNRPVTVERLEGGVFDRVVLRHVTIGAPASDPHSLNITIERVVVRYSLWDILVKKKALADGLREIQLIRPLIRFERDAQGVWHTPNLISWAGPNTSKVTALPPIKLTLTNGEMRFSAPGQTASLHHVRGFLNFKDSTRVPLFLSGRTGTEHSQNLKVSGELDLTRGQFNLGLTAENLALRPVDRLLQSSPFFEILEGSATISLKAKTRAAHKNDLIPGVDLQGKLVLNQCALKTSVVTVPVCGLVGVTLLNNDRLTIKSLQGELGKTLWQAKGTIEHLQRPTLFLTVEDSHLKLIDLVESFPRFGQLKTTGEGSAVISVQGTVPDLTATASLHLANGKIGQVRIQNFESISRYAQGELNLLLAKGVVAHGTAEGHGRIRLANTPGESPLVDFSLQAHALDLHELGSLLKISNGQGRLDAQLAVTGQLDHPTWRGEVTTPLLTLAGNEFKNFRATLLASPESVEVAAKTSWGALSDLEATLSLARKQKEWLIQPLRLSRQGEELLRISGKYVAGNPASLETTLKGKNLPLALLPAWPSALKQINGLFSLSGRCTGSLDHPELDVRIASTRLCQEAEPSLDLKGDLFWNGERLQVRSLDLDHRRVRLQGLVDFKSKTVETGAISLESCPVETCLRLAGVTPAVHGRVQGSVNVNGPFSQLMSKGDLAFAALAGKGFAAQSGTAVFSSNGDNLWIKRFELNQGSGKFNATLETSHGKAGYVRARVWLDKFELAGHRYSGDLKADGALQNNATDCNLAMTTGNLERDAIALPPLAGTLVWQGGNHLLLVKNATWGNELNLTGQVNFEKTPFFSLQANFDHARLKTIREFFNRDAKAAKEPLTGSVRVQGTAGQAKADFNLLLGSGEINGTAQTLAAAGNTPAGLQLSLKFSKLKTQSLADLFLVKDLASVPDTKISGTFSLQPSAGKAPFTSGNITCTDFKYGQWTFSSLKAAWETHGDRIELEQLEGLQPDGSLKLSKGMWQIRPDGTYGLALDLAASNFYFFYKRFNGHFHLKGSVDSLDPFDLNLNVASSDFGLHNYTFGDLHADVHYKNDELRFQSLPGLPYKIVGYALLPPGGSVDFKRLEVSDALFKRVSAAGFIDGEGKGRSDFLVNVYGVPADTIARSFGWPQPWSGMARGSVHYTDPGDAVNVKIKVKVEDGSVLNIPFDSFSGTVLLEHDWLYFKAPEDAPTPNDPAMANGCVLRRGDKYTLLFKGRLPCPQTDAADKAMRGAEMDLNVVLPEGDLSYLVLIPYVASASGKSRLNLSIRGTMDYPSISGSATIEDGVIAPRLYTPKVDKVYADLRFDNNKMYIQRFEARLGEGSLTAKAGPAAPYAAVFRRLVPDELNLILESANGRLRLDATPDMEFISAWMTGKVTLNGTLDNPVFSGIIEFSDGNFVYPPNLLSHWAQDLKGGSVQYHDLRLITRKNFWFANDMLRAQIKPDNSVVFNGGKNDFSGEGRVAVSKGFFTYLDADFSLDTTQESSVTFQGRQAPVLHAVASTVIQNVQIKDEGKLRQVTIYMTVQGTVGALKLDLTSEPAMTQAQIMSLLTLGEDFSSWTKEQIDEKVQASGARMLGRWAGSLIGQQIKSRLQKIAPVDVVGIRFGGVENAAGNIVSGGSNTQTSGSQVPAETTGMSLLQDTQIDLGKYLTQDLYLNYRATLKDRGVDRGGLAWQSLVGLEYNLDATRKLKFTKDFDADNGSELFVGIEGRTEFKGWKPADADANTQGSKSLLRKMPLAE
jgi:hypothetical protein